jgi:hypothetical protein
MRRTLALVAVAASSAFASVILGEYVLSVGPAVAAGVVLAILLGELVLGIAKWRGVVPALFTGACGAASIGWAGYIESGRGVAPMRGTVWIGVVIAAALGAWRLWPRSAGGRVSG